jgi:L-threonylcarbamoyladenylate synthase
MPDLIKTAEDGALQPSDAARAGAATKACRIVAIPTETGYALASTGLIKAATRRLLQIKERPTQKPFQIMVASVEEAARWGVWTPLAEKLAAALWPGPVALLLKPTAQGRLLTFAEYPTIAVRIPSNPAARSVLTAVGAPLTATSANKSGRPPLTTAAAVAAEFGAEVDIIIDGGEVPSAEPTIVDASGERPRVVREGVVPSATVLGAVPAA